MRNKTTLDVLLLKFGVASFTEQESILSLGFCSEDHV